MSFDEKARSIGHDAEVAGWVRVADASIDKRGSQRWTEVSGRDQWKSFEGRELGEHVDELASEKSPFDLDSEGGDRSVRCLDVPHGIGFTTTRWPSGCPEGPPGR